MCLIFFISGQIFYHFVIKCELVKLFLIFFQILSMPNIMQKWPSLPKLSPVSGYDSSRPSGWMIVKFAINYYWPVSFCFPKDYMPFSGIYVSTFKHEAEYRQLLIQTALALQTNKFMQVRRKDAFNVSLLRTSLVNLKVLLDPFQQCSQWKPHEAKHPVTCKEGVYWKVTVDYLNLYRKQMQTILPISLLCKQKNQTRKLFFSFLNASATVF